MGEQLPLFGKHRGSILERFNAFDEANPSVWSMFVRFAFELIRCGRERYSADALLHRIRWEVAVNTVGDDFKVNNDFAALYARKFREQYPEHAGFFETRERRAA